MNKAKTSPGNRKFWGEKRGRWAYQMRVQETVDRGRERVGGMTEKENQVCNVG